MTSQYGTCPPVEAASTFSKLDTTEDEQAHYFGGKLGGEHAARGIVDIVDNFCVPTKSRERSTSFGA
jgi:hypothetical protein